MSKYSQALASMQEEWNMSQGQYDQQFGGAQIPEGEYVCTLQSARLTQSKSSGRLMIAREHLIQSGEHQGKVIYDYMMLGSARNLVYVRRWIEMMGYECPAEPEAVEATIEAIDKEAPSVQIRVSTDGEYTNADVVKLLDDDASGGTEETSQDEGGTQEAEYTVEDLVAFCKEVGIDLSSIDKEDSDAIMAEIVQYALPQDSLNENQVAMLEQLGLTDAIDGYEATTEESGTEQSANEEDTELKERLIKFMIGQGIEYEKDDTVDQMQERIDAFEYPSDKITDEEKELLVDIGQEANIKQVAPPKKAPPKKAPPKKAPPKKAASGNKAAPKKDPPKKVVKKAPPKKK